MIINPKKILSKHSRKPINLKKNNKQKDRKLTYKDAGVDIDAGNLLVSKIKPFIEKTKRPEVMAEGGGFGGLFDFQSQK